MQNGGTAILSETPEIYGAEHLLTRRAVSQEVGEKLLERIRWWEEYTERNGGEMNNNPSPGNKAGGLTTILEKSLGAAAKGGTTNLAGVFRYAEPITRKGFVFMDSPGYDPASATGQVAGGAQHHRLHDRPRLLLRLQARALAQDRDQHPMYRRMEEDMDVNAGTIVDGEETVAAGRPAHLRPRGSRLVGREVEVGGPGHGRQRVRALADRRRHVVPAGSALAPLSGRGVPGPGAHLRLVGLRLP